ncbi:hypothetical protein PPL_07109 [Heterostelium album PN500]|uniref:NADPH-dependent FMN reductase-like domain-containing protein n=1 Tax=Heterostelium pallidum (strain ATCC 26659 / Pp 5 / PN500) TaxID=670386 RepID=D3BEF0_HETP5|nr:hypothetical protein PPL_07109 [Heterostelium album PN500]EFA80281.1 hypothetical protein PPL_07109 [Heterostelium album PN500]|eukprot:XP_020432401.1 hypothetical protein PPL_07109 [Heterostelium album PN500]
MDVVTTQSKHKIGVIVSGARDTRIGNSITEWILRTVPKSDFIEYSVIDLKTWNTSAPTPMFEFTASTAHSNTTKINEATTSRWSREVAEKSGFIFITPEYNYGYPPSIKNCLDHVRQEWNGKPAVLISYGFSGGASAASHLKPVLVDSLLMKILDIQPQLVINYDILDKTTGQFFDINGCFKQYEPIICKSIFELYNLLNTNNSDIDSNNNNNNNCNNNSSDSSNTTPIQFF